MLALLYGGSFGGLRMHLIPMFVVLAAGLLRSQSTGQNVSKRDMVLAGAGAGLLSMLLAGVVLRPRPQGDGGGGGGSGRSGGAHREPADPGRLGDLFDRLLRALGLNGDAEGVERGEAAGGAPEPESTVNWRLLLALLLLVLFLLLMVWLIHRWRSQRPVHDGQDRWALIQRFEQVGEDVGSPRQSSQGLVAYGDRLSSRADERPRHTGSALSGLLYDPNAGDAEFAERLVSSLETNPPTRTAATETTGWLARLTSRFRNAR